MFAFKLNYLKKEQIALLMKLDQLFYKEEHRSSEKVTLGRLKVNPETDIVIMDQDNIVGYISLLPIQKGVFNKIKSGSFQEIEVEKNVIESKEKGFYYAYLSSIVVNKIRYPKFPGWYLFQLLSDHLTKLRKRGIFIREMIAFAVSRGGRKILTQMGFREGGTNLFIYSCFKSGIQFIKNKISSLISPHYYAFYLMTVKDVDV